MGVVREENVELVLDVCHRSVAKRRAGGASRDAACRSLAPEGPTRPSRARLGHAPGFRSSRFRPICCISSLYFHPNFTHSSTLTNDITWTSQPSLPVLESRSSLANANCQISQRGAHRRDHSPVMSWIRLGFRVREEGR